MTGALLRAVLGTILVALPGGAALRGVAQTHAGTRSGSCALAFTLGLAVLVPAVFAAGFFGIALGIPAIATISLLLAAAISMATRVHADRPTDPVPFPRTTAVVLSRLLLASATVLFVAKIALVPVWSWDYYAVHGVRARRMFSGQHLRLGQLGKPGLEMTHPDYPPGIPIAWRILTLGGPPDAASVKIAHVLFGLALLALVREAVLASGRSEIAANTAAAFGAISPLFWDTESLGLVEAPFALLLCAAFCLLLKSSREPGEARGWAFGAIAGFLPWIKMREGLTLAAFLTIAMLLSGKSIRRKAVVSALLASVLWAAAAIGICAVLLPPGESFLVGGWLSRGFSRAAHPGAIVGAIAGDLLAPEWFGFWIVFAAGWLYSIASRRRTAAILGSVIVAQLAAYVSVYFVTYLNPADHIRSSFFRITAALLPAAIIVLVAIIEKSTDSGVSPAVSPREQSAAPAAARGGAAV
jgi:hypothetical protein